MYWKESRVATDSQDALPSRSLLCAKAFAGSSTTVSLNWFAGDDHTRDTAAPAPRSRRGVGTSSRWNPARAVQDARGAPRGVKPLGRRAGRRKASDSGGKCASRSEARNAYAAMQREA